jgi:hypothetical protein
MTTIHDQVHPTDDGPSEANAARPRSSTHSRWTVVARTRSAVPCSSISRSKIRFAVCRCSRGASDQVALGSARTR